MQWISTPRGHSWPSCLSRFCRQALGTGFLLGLFWGAMLFWPPAVQAATCTVPSVSYATIQAAVDDTICDTVNIDPGTYTHTVNITRSITLRGSGPSTILDGRSQDRPLTVSGSGVGVRARDFNVTNGDATYSEPQVAVAGIGRLGGGIVVYDGATLYLTDVEVSGNVARSGLGGGGYGGGIGLHDGATLHAANVQVRDNRADTGPGSGFGGGVAVLYATAYFTDSEILDNRANAGLRGLGKGGGLYLGQDTDFAATPRPNTLHMARNRIAGNTAAESEGEGLGGGLAVGDAETVRVYLYANDWRGNVAQGANAEDANGLGGGVAVDITAQADVQLHVEKDTFYSNIANAVDGLHTPKHPHGGGLYLDASAPGWLTATLTGTVFSGNIAYAGALGTAVGQGGALRGRNASITLYDSLIDSNTAGLNGYGQGGGIRAQSAGLKLARTVLRDNGAPEGAGLYFHNSAAANAGLDMVNSWVVDNTGGPMLQIDNDNPARTNALRHVTVASAGMPDSVGVAVNSGTVYITNTLVANQAVGLYSPGGNVDMHYTFFSRNLMDTVGSVNSSNVITGSPGFVDPPSRDYHIRSSSDAVDAGTDLGVAYDIDRQARDGSPDVGADEYYAFVDAPIQGLSIVGPSRVTATDPATFTASLTAGTHISYSWDFGNGATGTGNPIAYTYATTGSYNVTVTATNDAGSVRATNAIQVADPPAPDDPIAGLAATSNAPTVLGEATTFIASIRGGTGISYRWDFGDGVSGSGQTPMHTYPAPAVYTATVTAGNSQGREQTQTVVRVNEARVND